MRAPPTGYLEIERALRLLALGGNDAWVAGRLRGVDHPAAAAGWSTPRSLPAIQVSLSPDASSRSARSISR